MPRGVYDRQPTAAAEEADATPASVKMVPMKLLRHYKPVGEFSIVGYLKAKVEKKFPNGETKVVEPEEFIEGEQAPAPFPGVVSTGKIWASTTIMVAEDEGKTMKRLGIAERDFD